MNHLQHNLIQETHVTPSRDEDIVDLVTDKHGLQCCQQTRRWFSGETQCSMRKPTKGHRPSSSASLDPFEHVV